MLIRTLQRSITCFLVAVGILISPLGYALVRPTLLELGWLPYTGSFIGINYRTDGSDYNPYDNELDAPSNAADTPYAGMVDGFVYHRLGILPPVQPLENVDPLNSYDRGALTGALREGVAVVPTDYDGNGNYETTTVIGHSTDWYPHAYSNVFAPLGQARIGDMYELTVNGETETYRVVEIYEIDPTDAEAFATLERAATTDRSLLVTCWPLFSTARRLVVVGDAV